ncbi:MAG: GAF domain-containing sensor histidine kinase [Anaerolineae bacterium]|nr:GAF domain-containing sensor histidine kinase [Anaerolineae bacterium]
MQVFFARRTDTARKLLMFTPESVRGRFQIDWIISNLRWLLLLSVAVVSVLHSPLVYGKLLDPFDFIPQVILIVIGALYNVGVMLFLHYGPLRQAIPVISLAVDTVLSISLVLASGGLTSPLLFFALFPILTAALRFSQMVSLAVTGAIILLCGLFGYLLAPLATRDTDLASFIASSFILGLAALVSGAVSNQMKQIVARRRRQEEEAELRKLRAAREHSRVIFELASTLSATLNYHTVLEAVLDVGEAGMRELGQPNLSHVSLVLLFGEQHLHIVTSRHLPHRDQNIVFEGRRGALAQALSTAELQIVNDPASDPELGQLIAMQGCKQAIIVPLRAGFENYGAVVFASAQPDTYNTELQELLVAVCNQAIVALQNAQLYQSLREEKERIVEVEEAERKKLARDLHDGPTQSIAAIAMRLNYVRMLLERQQDLAQVMEELTRIEELARRTTKEIRQMLFTLRPLILETQGLKAALEQYVAKLAETDPLPIHLQAAPEIDNLLERNAQGVIFYIIEEAIGNARKHAKAKNLWVRLYTRANMFIAEVEDDGVGFDVDAVQARYDERGSLGMLNMHERADMIGGKLSIASAPGRGTRITLTVPLQNR